MLNILQEEEESADDHQRRVVKCWDCIHKENDGAPKVRVEKEEHGETASIIVEAPCSRDAAFTLVIDKNLDVVSHSCNVFRHRPSQGEKLVIKAREFDVDKFLDGDDELESFFSKKKHGSTSLEHSMLSAVQSLGLKMKQPLGVMIPTTARLKSQAEKRAEEQSRTSQMDKTSEENLTYLRILEFEKLAGGHHAYPLDKFCKALHGIDAATITGFINKIDNEFLIYYDSSAKTVRFYNPSPPELEILSRAFEKWLRFNRF